MVQKTHVVEKQTFVVDAVGASVAEDVVVVFVAANAVAGDVVEAFVVEFVVEVLEFLVQFLEQLVVWVHVADLFVFYPAEPVAVGHLVVFAVEEYLLPVVVLDQMAPVEEYFGQIQ